ncbi:MAG: hypothetical protein ACXVX9_12195 [Mycobacteriaceae bacterium]
MKRTIIISTLAVLALAGCDNSPPTHKDPRQGRVTITYSDCAWGSCIYDWKVCVGPDLETHIDDERYVTKSSPECQP